MPSKEQIDKWIKEFETGENNSDDVRFTNGFLARLVEGKVLVDRWRLYTNVVVFNSNLKERIIQILGDKWLSVAPDSDATETSYRLWGADIWFTPNIDQNKCILLATDELGNLAAESGRAVAIVPLDGLKL